MPLPASYIMCTTPEEFKVVDLASRGDLKGVQREVGKGIDLKRCRVSAPCVLCEALSSLVPSVQSRDIDGGMNPLHWAVRLTLRRRCSMW